MNIQEEETAYAEVFKHLFQNWKMRKAILQTCVPQNDGVILDTPILLNNALGGVMNVYGWWYLVHRTCQAQGAKMVIEWLWNFGAGNAGKTAFMALDDSEVFRKSYTDWLKTKEKWWEQDYSGIVVNGIGPWPKTGTGDE